MKTIDWNLYAIIDHDWLRGRDIQKVGEQLIAGGAGIIQYRNKTSNDDYLYLEAGRLAEVTQQLGVPLVINNRADIAQAVYADGVHVGQNDLPCEAVRRLVGPTKTIGLSVRNLEEYDRATHMDYLGVGALFPTETKADAKECGLDLVKTIRKELDKPLIGIGGITLDNVADAIVAGCDGVAVISAILGREDIQSAAREFVDRIQETRHRFL